MTTLSERIQTALQHAALSPAELSRRTGISESAISQWLKGETRALKSSNAFKVAQACGVSPEWLATGRGRPVAGRTADNTPLEGLYPVPAWESADELPEGQFVLVPRFKVQLSAGTGRMAFHIDRKRPLPFLNDWIRSIGVRNVAQLVLVYAGGDSMEPRIRDGDLLLMDMGQQQVRDGQIYGLRYREELRVKRLFTRVDGGLLIRSDNLALYPDEIIAPDSSEHLEILGRIVWAGGAL